MFLAGLPTEIPCVTLNRFCSSGLEAVGVLASKIKSGFINIGVCGGVE